MTGGWNALPPQQCYSAVCRSMVQPPVKKRYWKHPAIHRMRVRIRMCMALDVLKSLVTPFASFVPRAILNYFSKVTYAVGHGNKEAGLVHCEVAHGAVLFADASGFTKLTELLAKGQSKAGIPTEHGV